MVRFWTIRILVQVHRHWVQSSLARRGYDTHNCHNKPQIGNATGVWITSCPEAMGWEFVYFEKQSIGDKMLNWEPAADKGLWVLSDPRLSNPAKMRKYCWVNIAVCPRFQLLSHTTDITLSRIKCEICFYKEVCSFVHWSSSLLLTVYAYISIMYMYVAIQQKKSRRPAGGGNNESGKSMFATRLDSYMRRFANNF